MPLDTTNVKLEARAALAEAVACCFFVFFGAGSVCAALAATDGIGPVEPINYATAFGFSIAVLAFAIGNLTGAHINPAVTISLCISYNLKITRMLLYIPCQIVGGILGGGLLRLCVGKEQYHSGIALHQNINAGQGFLLEFMGTLLLLFVVFLVAVWSANPLQNDMAGSTTSALAPLPIGMAVLVIHLTLGPFTGCGINPARVIGAVVWHDDFFDGDYKAGKYFWIYILGPFTASLVAPVLYFLLHGSMKPGSANKEGAHVQPLPVPSVAIKELGAQLSSTLGSMAPGKSHA